MGARTNENCFMQLIFNADSADSIRCLPQYDVLCAVCLYFAACCMFSSVNFDFLGETKDFTGF